MTEDQEFKPLVAGALNAAGNKREKIDFPVGKMIQVHISEGRYTYVDKEVVDRETEEKKTIKQAKVLFTFGIDDGDLKGKEFVKGITLSMHDRATYPKLSTAALGTVATDPSELVGKPLQVMFAAEADFEGTKYQPITYLPPAEGQTVPKKDVVLTELDDNATQAELDEIFGDDKPKEA